MSSTRWSTVTGGIRGSWYSWREWEAVVDEFTGCALTEALYASPPHGLYRPVGSEVMPTGAVTRYRLTVGLPDGTCEIFNVTAPSVLRPHLMNLLAARAVTTLLDGQDDDYDEFSEVDS